MCALCQQTIDPRYYVCEVGAKKKDSEQASRKNHLDNLEICALYFREYSVLQHCKLISALKTIFS